MTKKEYKKARDCLADFKITRGLVWLRLFLTLLAFICSLITTALFELEDVFGVDTASLEESVLVNIILGATLLLLMEPLSLFSLKCYGAYSSIGWYEVFESGGLYTAIKICAFIIGVILLLLFFKTLKKTKNSASAFVGLILFCVVDQLLAMNYYGFPSLYDDDFVIVYMTYLINIVTVVMCCRATYCANYLHKRFDKGVELKLRELKRIYKRNKT